MLTYSLLIIHYASSCSCLRAPIHFLRYSFSLRSLNACMSRLLLRRAILFWAKHHICAKICRFEVFPNGKLINDDVSLTTGQYIPYAMHLFVLDYERYEYVMLKNCGLLRWLRCTDMHRKGILSLCVEIQAYRYVLLLCIICGDLFDLLFHCRWCEELAMLGEE